MNNYCTIIASNYLPQLFTLHKSLLEHDKDARLFVLITDARLQDTSEVSFLNVFYPEEIEINISQLRIMKTCYNRAEFATSLKPFFLEFLLIDRCEALTFLDPDIQVFGTLEEGFKKASETGLALTPHRLSPDNLNSRTELNFLKFGVFNLGFISVTRSGLPFLRWWQEKVKWECFNFSEVGLYTDQKWVDLVPAFFPYSKIENPGFNLAFWNINERCLTKNNGLIYSNNAPLSFVHFSNMSASLIVKNESDLWTNALKNSKDGLTLQIIQEITMSYHIELMHNFHKSKKLAIIQSKSMLGETLSPIYRFKLMKTIKSQNDNTKIQKMLNTKRLTLHTWFYRLTQFFYKSDSIRLLQLGLDLDFKKLRIFLIRSMRDRKS